MRLASILIAAFLPLAVYSTPLVTVRAVEDRTAESTEAFRLKMESIVAVRDADASSVGLVKRNEYCDIVHVATTVNCYWLPKHGGNGNHKVTEIAGTRNNVEFSCYTDCEDVNGNTSWDWAINHGCYVPGYYTDATCSRANLGKCAFYTLDRSYGGCD